MSFVAETATLVHGFTMADVERASRTAASRAQTSSHLSWNERYDIAWMAIVEAIYDSDGPPEEGLTKVGLRAVGAEGTALLRQHGLGANRGEDEFTPRFTAYWIRRPDTDFTDKIVERLSLPQVLSTLTPLQYEALAALAVYGSQKAAAEALGVEITVFYNRTRKARSRAIAAWFGDETPRAPVAHSGDACQAGHSRSEWSVVLASGIVGCRKCNRNAARRRRAREK